MNIQVEQVQAKVALSEPQKIALATYSDGEFAHMLDSTDEAELATDLERCGDGLLRFLMIELASSEGAHTLSDGQRRVQAAICDLVEVQDAIELEMEKGGETTADESRTSAAAVEPKDALCAGLQLRVQALALLKAAQAMDGLKPFTVTHSHATGESTYVLWAKEITTVDQAESVLDSVFEPDKDEWLAVEENFALEEMTGVAVTARLDDILASTKQNDVQSN